ncbi:SDR family NAD(P)-dependent oxidoreductase [Nocardioides massiliensis]|uniref:NAD(P)-dependent dehydrogenase (Short-subunit alcohol dehydrogenase family) n=1 Tax=Nocardioides massiliensis TaxID=1325935 RepID=A0ABT9NTC2_9ACTN|nr:SDR family oxidoreductase [Nocardioides massiliensis]MDP9823638.1 NAD(P)-dependent dehydrogenase (short-subunit alcohol dehydrogenase family) [Nocardioides massiliensis]
MTNVVMPDEGASIPAKEEQTKMLDRAFREWGSELSGRVAVVTGGARGLGRTIAECLMRSGAKVVAVDKSWEGADAFRQELEAKNGLAVTVDITDDAALDTAYELVMAQFGTVDILINNAALVSETLFYPTGHRNTLDTTDEDWQKMFDVNLFGALKVIRRFIAPMRANGRGSILNVVSSGVLSVSSGGAFYGLRPWTVEMPYQATKAALTALTFYLAEEVRTEGIAVNALMPGHTRTSWFDDTARAFNDIDVVYFMRPAVAEHVLPCTLFLASQNAAGATGRLYYVPEWNYDYGYGDYSAWLDHELPADMEEGYARLEAAMPTYERSGVPHLPFDAQGALYAAAMANMGSREGWAGGSAQ